MLGADFLYKSFEERIVAHTVRAPDAASGRRCGSIYACGDQAGEQETATCSTECYLLDDNAFVVMHHTLGEAEDAAEQEYHDVSLGQLEGELVRKLNARGLLRKQEYYDFQGVCYRTPPIDFMANTVAPSISAQAQDDQARLGGNFRAFSNKYSCQKLVTVHILSTPDSSPTQTGIFNGPCDSGSWVLTRVPGTRLFLLAIDERRVSDLARSTYLLARRRRGKKQAAAGGIVFLV